MPKEVLFEIINKKLFWELALILILYYLNNLALIILGLKFNGVKLKLKSLQIGVFFVVLYCLLGKIIIPNPLFGLGPILIDTFLYWILAKINPIKGFLTSIFILLLSGLGAIIIIQPLAFYDKSILNFILESPIGAAVGTVLEAALPAIVLFLFPLFKIPSYAVKSKATSTDFLGMVIFGALFFAIYYLSVLFFWLYKNSSITVAILVLEVILLGVSGLVFFYIFKRKQRKYLEQNQVQTYLEQSHRLIDVLFSERRDYRNKLQVMNMMAAGNKTEQLNEYIFKSIDELAAAGMNNIQNPILAAAIVSRQVAAKEQDVAIMVQCDNPFQDPPVNPVKLGELFELLLDILIESELVSRCSPRVVFINIMASNQEYIFDFHNSEAATANLAKAPEGKNAEYLSIDKAKQKNQLELVEKLLNEINGEYSVSFQGDALVGLKITFRKNGKKFSLPA